MGPCPSNDESQENIYPHVYDDSKDEGKKLTNHNPWVPDWYKSIIHLTPLKSRFPIKFWNENKVKNK